MGGFLMIMRGFLIWCTSVSYSTQKTLALNMIYSALRENLGWLLQIYIWYPDRQTEHSSKNLQWMVSEEKIKKSVSKSNFSILKFLKRRFFLAYLLKIYCFWIVKKCWKPYVSNTFLFPIISYQTTTGNYNLNIN